MTIGILASALAVVVLAEAPRGGKAHAQEARIWICVSFGLYFDMTDDDAHAVIRRPSYLRAQNYGVLCPSV